MSSLREFLRDISIDPAKLSDYISDPKTYAENADLDDRSRRALSSRSSATMWEVLLDRGVSDSAEPTESEAVATTTGGSLTVVGTGIRTVGQLTVEAIAHIKTASKVFYLVSDPIAQEVVKHLNPDAAESLLGHYGEGTPRIKSYEGMINQIVDCVRSGTRTCAAFYGHPGVFAYPSHESIRRARSEGFPARMLPGVSAEDCLVADLGVDPAVNGCQSFEATDFLLYDRALDTSCQLILWQVGVVGDVTYRSAGYNLDAVFPLLKSRLCHLYGFGHKAIVYDASILPGFPPKFNQLALGSLSPHHVTASSTLYVPPSRKKK
jgi:hypothetical protein